MGNHAETSTNGGEGWNEDSTGHDGRGVTRTEDGEPHEQDQILGNQPASASTTDLNSPVESDVDQLSKDFDTKMKVAEPAGHVDRQGVEPGENDNATVPIADGENGHGHLAEASTRAAIPAYHAEATYLGTEDVKGADVNDTPPKEGTSTMPRGDKDESGSSPASWAQEREQLRGCIQEKESEIRSLNTQLQEACQERDSHKNAATEKEHQWRAEQERFQGARQERQLYVNNAAEKAKEIVRLQTYSAEYLSRLKEIKGMLSNSSNPGNDGLKYTTRRGLLNTGDVAEPEGKPRVADAKRELSRLIEAITTRNVSPSKRSDVGARWIVPQGNEVLEADRKSLKYSDDSLESEIDSLTRAVAELETENTKLQKNLRNLEIEHGRISQSGAYRENSATPTHVSEGFTNLSVTVDFFQRRLVKYMLQNRSADSVNDAYSNDYGEVNPLRPNHLPALFLKAEATRILFKNFENESFTEEGYSVCPDSAKRREKFFTWFLHFRDHKGDQDEDFVRYYERTKARAWEKFGIQNSGKDMEGLDNAFRKAAQNVWSLHLLSFSFEPPASPFRFRRGAAFDQSYMEAPASLEVDQDSVANVAFMMTPGLRVNKASLIKSEIYPIMRT